MTTITAPNMLAPKYSDTAVARAGRHSGRRSQFSEVREQARQRTLMIAATATGILSVTVAASAAAVITLGA